MCTIGADPEVFVKDSRTGGVIPVCGLLGGTKDKPIPIEELGEGYAVQEDNVMAEFNIPPCTSYQKFDKAISQALDAVANLVRTKSEHFSLDYASARMFSHEMLDSAQARMFGCSADYNAHSQGEAVAAVNPRDLEQAEGAWRFAGGHVHLGYKLPDEMEIPDYVVAQFADVFLGLPAVALDQQGERRNRYGQAGRFRPTAYGIEYRTLSNFWIFDAGLRQEIGHKAIQLGLLLERNFERLQPLYHEVPWMDVKTAIDTENVDLAADLLAYITNDLKLKEVM
jgi:hypothetical protein